jgi:hypothetical protein
MMKAILLFYKNCLNRLGKIPYDQILTLPGWEKISSMRYFPNDKFEAPCQELLKEMAAGELAAVAA